MTAARRAVGGRRTGVVVMSYGTPATPADVAAYYTHIRRGRPPTPEQLADLQRRYAAIGGTSPLAARTAAQADAVAAALGPGFTVRHGAKHAPPFLEDAVAGLAGDGVDGVVGVVLAPHWSTMSVGEYATRADAAAAAAGLPFTMVPSWHLEPPLLDALAERVRELLPVDLLLVTAHSLPERILATGDPYPEQLHETAAAVAGLLGDAAPPWRTAWQSAGRTPEPWLGPDVVDVIRRLPAEGVGSVAICPAGFTADHLEVLYDLDVEAARAAAEVGVRFARTRSLNDDPRLAAAVATAVRGAAERLPA